MGSTLLPDEQTLFIKSRPYFEQVFCPVKQTENYKNCSFCQNRRKHDNVLIQLKLKALDLMPTFFFRTMARFQATQFVLLIE